MKEGVLAFSASSVAFAVLLVEFRLEKFEKRL